IFFFTSAVRRSSSYLSRMELPSGLGITDTKIYYQRVTIISICDDDKQVDGCALLKLRALLLIIILNRKFQFGESKMYFDEFKHQLPDSDEQETKEWLDAFEQVVLTEGVERARFLMRKLMKKARLLQIGLPPLVQTPYINTISPEQEPPFPG